MCRLIKSKSFNEDGKSNVSAACFDNFYLYKSKSWLLGINLNEQ
jgi:hypothetical protein